MTGRNYMDGPVACSLIRNCFFGEEASPLESGIDDDVARTGRVGRSGFDRSSCVGGGESQQVGERERRAESRRRFTSGPAEADEERGSASFEGGDPPFSVSPPRRFAVRSTGAPGRTNEGSHRAAQTETGGEMGELSGGGEA